MDTHIITNSTPKLTLFPVLKKNHTELGQHLPLETTASKLFSVKKNKKPMYERQFGKLMANVPIFIGYNVNHWN